jgi:hypothetical protein
MATETFLCEDGLVFDGIRCILPHGVNCEGRELLQEPQPSGDCPRQNGIFKMEECNKYLHCTRGQVMVSLTFYQLISYKWAGPTFIGFGLK